jgi:hypothetical protein
MDVFPRYFIGITKILPDILTYVIPPSAPLLSILIKYPPAFLSVLSGSRGYLPV